MLVTTVLISSTKRRIAWKQVWDCLVKCLYLVIHRQAQYHRIVLKWF